MRIARILFSFICVALISDTNATEIEKPLASWSETVMTIGRTWPLGEFNVFARAAGIPEQKPSERDRLWYVVLKKDGVLRMYCVRTRALSKQIDIGLFMGTADDFTAYLTDESGRLRYAARWRKKTGFVPRPPRKARKGFTQLRQYWLDYEEYFDRRMGRIGDQGNADEREKDAITVSVSSVLAGSSESSFAASSSAATTGAG